MYPTASPAVQSQHARFSKRLPEDAADPALNLMIAIITLSY